MRRDKDSQGAVLLVSVQGISVNVDPVFCTWLLYQPHRGSGMQQGRFSRLCWFRQVLQLEATHQAVKDRGEDHDLLDQEKMSNKELRTDGQGKKDLCVKRQRDAPGLVPLAKRREDEVTLGSAPPPKLPPNQASDYASSPVKTKTVT
ncbi:hypothetical protein KUCAC02_014822, partial [Chaenocephalus aceratus]